MPLACSRRDFLLLAGASLLTRPLRAESTAVPPRRLVLVPMGPELPNASIEFVQRSLRAFYDFQLDTAPRRALPKSAYYPPRQRYRAERLLEALEREGPTDAFRIVGLTGVDISTTKGNVIDWGILGLATISGRVAVLSNHRCRRNVRSPEQPLVRFGKTAVHEVGHTLGLEHCPNVGCLMEDAKGTVITTDHEREFCSKCLRHLEQAGLAAKTHPDIPW